MYTRPPKSRLPVLLLLLLPVPELLLLPVLLLLLLPVPLLLLLLLLLPDMRLLADRTNTGISHEHMHGDTVLATTLTV